MLIYNLVPKGSPLLCAAIFFALAGTTLAGPLPNGGFETGDFTGWSVYVQSGGNGNFFTSSSTASPLNSFPTPGPAAGAYYAVSDQSGPSAEALIHTFSVAPWILTATVTFDMFVNTYAPVSFGGDLDYTAGGTNAPNQYGRVDLLSASAGPFDTGSGVLANFYLGADPMTDGSVSNPYTSYSFDITPFTRSGGTFQLRFADVSNLAAINLGVDNVSVTTTTPEPSAAWLVSIGILALAAGKLRK